MKVLYVERDRRQRESVARMLRESGYQVQHYQPPHRNGGSDERSFRGPLQLAELVEKHDCTILDLETFQNGTFAGYLDALRQRQVAGRVIVTISGYVGDSEKGIEKVGRVVRKPCGVYNLNAAVQEIGPREPESPSRRTARRKRTVRKRKRRSNFTKNLIK